METLAKAAATATKPTTLIGRQMSDYETILYTGCLGLMALMVLQKAGGLQGILSALGFGGSKASTDKGNASADKNNTSKDASGVSKTTQSTEASASEWPAKKHFPADAHPADNSPEKVWSAADLAEFDGVAKPMYICVLGTVYDVSPSENFVPEKGYGNLWGGRDATYALSTMSLERTDANKLPGMGEHGWDLNASKEQEKSALVSWRDHFDEKYTVVGTHEAYVGFDWSPLNGIENPKKKKAEEAKRKAEAAAAATAAASGSAAAGEGASGAAGGPSEG